MKIVKLRFKNLNSLVGEWEINFRDKRFLDDGIFAIIGPTGAGKSTILDAITLGLYGQTPRLGKITKSSNEIMSKGEGECFSEVLFEVNDKEYLAYWYQHRSRRKANGELQSPKHEISLNGDILEDNLRRVPIKIEEICGLDFNKMRRSILLAQGSFDSFLKADATQRAPLLEDITGTEIYSKISMKVHKRRNNIKREFELREERLKGICILDGKVEMSLKSDLAILYSKSVKLDKKIDILEEFVKDFNFKSEIEKEIKSLDSNLKKVEKRIKEFESKREDIKNIRRAIDIESDYNKFIDLNSTFKSKVDFLDNLRSSFSRVKSDLENLEIKKTDKSLNLQNIKDRLENQKVIFDEIKRLDIDILYQSKRVKEAQDNLKSKEESLESLDKKLQKSNLDLKSYIKTLHSIEEELDSNKKDGKLQEELSLIEERLNIIRLKESEFETLKSSLTSMKESIKSKKSSLNNIKDKITKFKEKLKKARELYELEKIKLDKLLKSGGIVSIQSRINSLNKKREDLKELIYSIKEGQKLKKGIEKFNKDIKKLKEMLIKIDSQIKLKVDNFNLLKSKERLLEENLDLIKRVYILKNERKKLEHGKPCPLCGSIEHPYAMGNAPKKDKREEELKLLKNNLLKLEAEINQLKIDRAKFEQEIDLKIRDIKNLDKEFIELKDRFGDKIEQLGLKKETIKIEILEKESDNIESEISDLSNLIKEIEKQRDSLNRVNIDYNRAKEDYEAVLDNRDKLFKELEILQDRQNNKSKELNRIKSDIEILKNNNETLFKHYNIDINQKDILKILKDRAEKYQNLLQNFQNLKIKVEKLKSNIESFTKQKEIIEIEVFKLKESMEGLKEQLNSQKSYRFEKFQNKNPLTEEKLLLENIKNMELEYSIIEKKYIDKKSLFDKSMSQIESVKLEIDNISKDLKVAKKSFEKRLNNTNFKSIEEFLNVIKIKDSLGKLEELEKSLEDNRSNIVAVLDNKTKTLNELKFKLNKINFNKIENILIKLNNKKANLLEEIGKVKERLDSNDRAKKKHKFTIDELNLIKKELKRWEKLYELIGSADGKRFRNFAQGLTFEIVIEYANEILGRLSDRYYLIRDKVSPLELNVIDIYQANRVRSVKNLSGGESFIVSLSLAIGLSKMVSGKVRVDSLFLDEGFGTLDEESLETALITLSSLQQSEGKIIGVISHINLIKERIYNHIELIPTNSGKSEIRGVGVVRVSN